MLTQSSAQLAVVAGFGNHQNVGMLGDDLHDPAPDDGVVVDNDGFYGHGHKRTGTA